MEYIWIIVYAVIAVFGYNCSDYASYKFVYDTLIPAGVDFTAVPDIGYDLLSRLGSALGLSFEVFRGLYILAALFLFYKAVRYFCDRPAYVFFLYFLFPFFLDAAQFRFFMAYAIAFFALRYMAERKYWAYILLVILAASQHLSVLVFLLFLLVNMDRRKLSILVLIAVAAECIVFFFAPDLLSLLLGNVVGRAAYYVQSDTYSLYLCAAHMGLAMLSAFLANFLAKRYPSQKKDFLSNVLLIAIAFVPLIIIDPNYMRLYRTVTPLIYIAMDIPGEKKGLEQVTNLYAAVYCLSMFFIFISPHNTTHWNGVVKALLTNNYLFDLFR